MKRSLLIILLVVSGLCSYGQARVGGGLSYGTEIEEMGLNITGEFFLKDKIALTPEINYFFTDNDFTFWTFNADVHYYFNKSSQASFYGLAGLNFANISNGNNSNSELGLNLGVGVNFEIGKSFTPFTQFKLVTGDADQAVLSFGLRFDIN